jgi:uncharacterized repeat protein (TIGR01451 family)/fimbrial isopeptide formation D2 family protein
VPDIAVDISVSPTSYQELQTILVSITATNTDTAPATASLESLVPAGFTYVSGSITGGVANNDSNPVTGLTWDLALLAGESQPLQYSVTVDKGAAGTFGNRDLTASLTASLPADTIPGNDSDTVNVTLIPFDASVTQAVSDTTPVEGQTVTFTLTVLNTTADATGTDVVIHNLVPAGFTYVGSTISGGSSTDANTPDSGTGLTWTIDILAPGASVPLIFQATVDVGAKDDEGPTIDSTGFLFSSAQQDSNSTNDSDTETLTISGLDISVTKTVNINNPIEGTGVTYTIAVQNNGSQTATNILVSDVVDSDLTYRASSIAGGISRNDASPAGTGLQWTIDSLAAGITTNLTFIADVNTGAAANNPIPNTASLDSLDQSEENSGNNLSSVDINARAFDLVLTNSINNPTPLENEVVTYTINVSNTSSSVEATDILVRDIVPAGLTYVGSSILGGTTRSAADPDGSGLEWTIASLPAGDDVDLTFQARVDYGAKALFPTITNTANIISVDQVESNTTNNTDSVVATIQSINISVTKAVDVATPVEGNQVEYTITVSNLSTQPMTGVVVRDVVPGGLTYVGSSISGGDLTDPSSPTGTGLQWTINSLAGGASENLIFRASINSGASGLGAIPNTASLFSTTGTEDTLGNNSGSVSVTAQAFDIAVTKAVNDPTPEEGQLITYTISVATTTAAAGTNIVINDIVPDGVTYEALSIGGGSSRSDATPTTSGGLSWTIASIAGNDSVNLTYQARVNNAAKADFGTITNTASLTSTDQVDSNAGNNSDDADIDVDGLDLILSKSVTSPAVEGQTVTYTVTVENNSGQTATNIEVSDLVPAGVT